MDGARPSACPGPVGQYLSGLCAAGLGLCAAGWLMLTPFAFGYQGRGWHAATLTDLGTGGGLAVICATTLIAWTLAWRRALRVDGMLTRRERAPARGRRERAGDGQGEGQAGAADPAQVLTALRTLLAPMLDTAAEGVPAVTPVLPGPRSAPEAARVPGDRQARSAEPGSMTAEPGSMTAEPGSMTAEPGGMPAEPGAMTAEPGGMPAGPEGTAVIESIPAGAEVLMAERGEERAW